jgi:plasmid segregation protein ParM
MLHISQMIAEQIEEGLSRDIAAMSAIDKAVRHRESTFKIGPHVHDMAQFRTVIDSAIDQSVKAMLEKTGALTTVGRILFTGGGALVYREYMQRQYKQWKDAMETDHEPVFANVRGFQVAAEQVAADRGVMQ